MNTVVIRVAGALVAAALAPALIGAVYAYFFSCPTCAERPDDWLDAFQFARFIFTLGIVAGVIYGLPVFLILNWLKAIRWWTCLAAGLALGLLVTTWLIDIAPVTPWRLENAPVLIGPLTIGASGSLAAWAVWRFWPARAAVPKAPAT